MISNLWFMLKSSLFILIFCSRSPLILSDVQSSLTSIISISLSIALISILQKDGFFGSFFVILGFPCDSTGKESTCNAGDLSLIPGLGRSLREVKGYPLQYSGLENSMDCVVHGVTKRHNWATFTLLLVIWYIVCILLYFRLWLFTI